MSTAGLRHVMMTTDAVGGVWTYSLDLARGFADRAIATTLVVLGPAPDPAQAAEAAAVPGLRLIDTGLPLDWRARHEGEVRATAAALGSIAERAGAELVHLHAPALAAGVRYAMPAVATAHSCMASWWEAVRGGPMPLEFRRHQRLTAEGLAALDAVIAPSRSFAGALCRCYRLRTEPTVVHNGRTPLASAALGRKEACVLTAGRLWDEAKNVALLDRAAAALDWPVFAAGPLQGPDDGPRHFAHLSLLGALPPAALARWYAKAAVFASPARYEPFGLAVLEAAQAGAALVLGDIPSFREIWGEAAVFVDPEDTAGLAAALRALLAEPARAAALGAAAHDRAQRYPVGAMVQRTLDLYHRLLAPERLRRAI